MLVVVRVVGTEARVLGNGMTCGCSTRSMIRKRTGRIAISKQTCWEPLGSQGSPVKGLWIFCVDFSQLPISTECALAMGGLCMQHQPGHKLDVNI